VPPIISLYFYPHVADWHSAKIAIEATHAWNFDHVAVAVIPAMGMTLSNPRSPKPFQRLSLPNTSKHISFLFFALVQSQPLILN